MPIFEIPDTPLDRCRDAREQLAQYRSTVNDLLLALGDPEEKAAAETLTYTAEPGEDPEYSQAMMRAMDDRRIATLESVRQGMLNLFAAGLFHLLEQLLAKLCGGDGVSASPPADTKLAVLRKWYAEHFKLSLKGLDDWPHINELRLAANVIKHGDGTSAEDLKKVNPQLFEPYSFWHVPNWEGRVQLPLAGGDLFVTDADLERYGDAAERFLGDVSNHLEQNGVSAGVSP